MATVEVSDAHPDHPRHTVTIEPGEKVAICRCWHSKKFPFCDGTHKEHPGRGPCIIVATASVTPTGPPREG